MLGVLYGNKSYIDPGLVGLSVSYALSVTQALSWVIRQYCEIETNIVSVERVKEYIDLPGEKYEAARSVDPMWPAKGKIEFRDYSTRYRDGLDLCLRDLSITITPKEKIGIVGRTGAGKSSLTLALFRIVEAAKGSIVIDGIDISSMRLFDLRSRLTIIPQDPVLFAGTVRENLDPFGTHHDAEIWQALKNSHLNDHISAMDGQLNGIVLEGGENFSVGQRQVTKKKASLTLGNGKPELMHQTSIAYLSCTCITASNYCAYSRWSNSSGKQNTCPRIAKFVWVNRF